MAPMTSHTNPDIEVAAMPSRHRQPLRQRFDLGALAAASDVNLDIILDVPADRLGLTLDPDGRSWLTIETGNGAARPAFTLLDLDDDEGRRQALDVMIDAARATRRGRPGSATVTIRPVRSDRYTVTGARWSA